MPINGFSGNVTGPQFKNQLTGLEKGRVSKLKEMYEPKRQPVRPETDKKMQVVHQKVTGGDASVKESLLNISSNSLKGLQEQPKDSSPPESFPKEVVEQVVEAEPKVQVDSSEIKQIDKGPETPEKVEEGSKKMESRDDFINSLDKEKVGEYLKIIKIYPGPLVKGGILEALEGRKNLLIKDLKEVFANGKDKEKIYLNLTEKLTSGPKTNIRILAELYKELEEGNIENHPLQSIKDDLKAILKLCPTVSLIKELSSNPDQQFEEKVQRTLSSLTSPKAFFKTSLDVVKDLPKSSLRSFGEFAAGWIGKNTLLKDYPVQELKDLASLLKQKGLSDVAQQILILLDVAKNRKINVHFKSGERPAADILSLVHSGNPLPAAYNLMVKMIANDLTAINLDALSQTESSDLVSNTKNEGISTGADLFITATNGSIKFIASQILLAPNDKAREKMVQFFLDVAAKARERGDYITVQNIVTAISSLGSEANPRIHFLGRIINLEKAEGDLFNELSPAQQNICKLFLELEQLDKRSQKKMKEEAEERLGRGEAVLFPIPRMLTLLIGQGELPTQRDNEFYSKKMDGLNRHLSFVDEQKKLQGGKKLAPYTDIGSSLDSYADLDSDLLTEVSNIVSPGATKDIVIDLEKRLPRQSLFQHKNYIITSRSFPATKAYFKKNELDAEIVKKAIDLSLYKSWNLMNRANTPPSDAHKIRQEAQRKAYEMIEEALKRSRTGKLSIDVLSDIAQKAVKSALPTSK